MPGINSNMLYPSFLRTRTICQFDLCSLLFRNVTHLNRLCSPQFVAMHSPRRIRVVKTLSRIPANPSSIPNLPVIILFSHSTIVFIINVFLLQGNNRAKKSPTTLGGLDINILFHYKVLIDFSQTLKVLKVLGVSGLRVFLPPLNSLTAQVVAFVAGVIVIGNVGYPVWNVPVT